MSQNPAPSAPPDFPASPAPPASVLLAPPPAPPPAPPATTTAGTLLAQSDDHIELGLPGSDYRLHLKIDSPLTAHVGDRIIGTCYARAKRVDITGTGGRFIEPVYGRPRRLQGRIVGGDIANNRIFVACGLTMLCTLTDSRQQAGDFAVGQIVGFDIESGASFEPMHDPD